VLDVAEMQRGCLSTLMKVLVCYEYKSIDYLYVAVGYKLSTTKQGLVKGDENG
jgi:hypothetical protein